jgi:hypothetical protein
MEPSALQRRITFGLIVLVLTGLGIYLIRPPARGSGRTANNPAARQPDPSPSAAAPSASPAAGVQPDIYQWLPFTPAGLTAAATVARRFGVAYGTFSYTESPGSYAAALQSLASAQLVRQITAAYSTPGVTAARSLGKQVSTGTAVIDSIRSFGPTSLTFVEQITEQLTATSGQSRLATTYAITLTSSGTDWQVTDIELASAGNP